MKRAVPEGEYVDIGDGLKVHYHAEGSGAPVVFLHGSGPGASGWSNFRRNYPEFARAGFRAIVPDTLGYGWSSKPDGVDYTLDFLVGALRRFLDALGVERAFVVGNSHGGAMSIGLALADPARVAKLVLMAPGGLEEREAYLKMAGIRAMMKAFLDPNGLSRESLRKVFELQLFDPALITDEILDERLEIAALQPKRVLTSMQVPHLAPRLKELDCPVFGLWGTNDQFCPWSGGVTLARECKRVRVELISQCGHWVMVEHAALFNRLCIDFLREPA
ncbi:MAG TPA: alpha/beta fold hydrolase [Polyangia bacterium]|nr:alpha/beta fold hydrolase [Polyangia bacterium]